MARSDARRSDGRKERGNKEADKARWIVEDPSCGYDFKTRKRKEKGKDASMHSAVLGITTLPRRIRDSITLALPPRARSKLAFSFRASITGPAWEVNIPVASPQRQRSGLSSRQRPNDTPVPFLFLLSATPSVCPVVQFARTLHRLIEHGLEK